jgi:hypothetical protein
MRTTSDTSVRKSTHSRAYGGLPEVLDGSLFVSVPEEKDIGVILYTLEWDHAPVPIRQEGELPMTKHYAIKLTRAARSRLRQSVRDLIQERVVDDVFDVSVKDKPLARRIFQTLRMWSLNAGPNKRPLEIGEIAAAAREMPSRLSTDIDIGLQMILTYVEPKPLRDELIRVALGERLPHFTHGEILRLKYGRED